MAASIQEHVCQRIPDFTRRPQDTRVEPFGEDRTAATERPVERTCDAGADRHHATRERIRVARLDEKVRVRGLQTVVDEPEVATIANLGKAVLEHANESHRAQRWKPGTKLHRHVRGKPRRDSVAPPVRDVRADPGFRPAPARRPPYRWRSSRFKPSCVVRPGIAELE